jgi:hydrogenase-1 operon protein HyaE
MPMTVPDVSHATSTALHPLLRRLLDLTAAPVLDGQSFERWTRQPGHALLVFADQPVQLRETLDLAVIVPELAAALPGRFRVGVLLAEPARALAVHFGIRRWPALVLLKDGGYVGSVEGLRDWQVYLDELTRLLAAEPTRPPSIGIALRAQSAAAAAGHCH